MRVGYMEKRGKRFVAVRMMFKNTDVVLENEVIIDPVRHLGAGKRFAAEATVVGDEPMLALLTEAVRKNPDQKTELARLRAAMKKQ